jgi:hypothetical protein
MSNIASHRRVSCHMDGNRVIETGPAPDWRVPPPIDPESGSPNCRLASGGVPQGNRVFTPADGPFHFKGDLPFHIALTRAVPGSLTEEFALRCSRNLPVFEPLREFTGEEKTRYERFRYNPYELSKAQIEDREKMRVVLLEHLAALG